MKNKLSFIVLCFFLLVLTTKAAECTNEEKAKLKKEAKEVKMVLTEKQEEMDPSTYFATDGYDGPAYYYYFDVSLTNVTDNLFVEVSTDRDDTKITSVTNPPKNGIMTFKWDDIYKITKFTYTVIAKNSETCNGEVLYKGYATAPKYNYFAEAGICNGVEDYKYCNRFIYEDVNSNEIYRNVKSYKQSLELEEAKKANSWKEKIKKFVKKHKVLIIAGTSLIVVGGGTVVILKQRRKRVM